MRLLSQSHSPFARKVVVLIHELGRDDIVIEHHETSPTNPNRSVAKQNPLGKVPVLITDNGEAIYDSDVICDFLCQVAGPTPLLPLSLDERISVLRMQALAGGMCEAGIAIRWETERRPEHLRFPSLRDGQIEKLSASYAYLEDQIPMLNDVTVGTIALACALDWLSFRGLDRYASKATRLRAWLEQFNQRASMQESRFEGLTYD
ncbi:glutathione S-transferase family protein [Epibacterium sp. Ofav1-8]|uniref:glutathione S-transferase family protein n=1 Tax=Epibacterium sp. Ofav1-8 TaxID=2917735 RepID=UPI001EF43E19|nr:glutathione S-transferase N-terminal domain-containing protein [Epibacterium sp. Ofav1-8]MCG7625132.1 glutathione S-transferase N-terminal domain-containing protein [Epibacterium sp. Ofav1-8]